MQASNQRWSEWSFVLCSPRSLGIHQEFLKETNSGEQISLEVRDPPDQTPELSLQSVAARS